jgi:hypothetical protein
MILYCLPKHPIQNNDLHLTLLGHINMNIKLNLQVVWIVGYEFWVLPNLFDETIPWSESCSPLMYFAKNYDDETFLFMR